MKLQKASTPIISYPKREHIKPILLSATVALALTACVPHTAGKTPTDNRENPYSTSNTTHEGNQEVNLPDNIAGGIPAPIYPPDENNQTWSYEPKK